MIRPLQAWAEFIKLANRSTRRDLREYLFVGSDALAKELGPRPACVTQVVPFPKDRCIPWSGA